MTNRHLTEEEIQLLVTEQPGGRSWINTHLESCDKCREEVVLFQSLVNDIARQTPACFDFDLEALVSSGLQPAKVKKDGLFIGIPISVGLCLVLGVLYIFRSNFLLLTDDTSVVFLYASLVSCVFILVIKSIGLYRKYQDQIKALNFS